MLVYVVSDLRDPSVHRRVRQLSELVAGRSAITVVAGERERYPDTDFETSVNVVRVGTTRDSQFLRRLGWARQMFGTLHRSVVRGASDNSLTIVAKHLDCAVIALLVIRLWAPDARLGYEVLDIHPLLSNNNLQGRIARFIERLILRRADFLSVSSRGFVTGYFDVFHEGRTPPVVALVENRVPASLARIRKSPRKVRPIDDSIIRLGYFGTLRCKDSLKALLQLAALDQKFHVVLAGRSFRHEDWLEQELAKRALENVFFLGSYRYPVALPALYAQVDLVWAIDMSDQSLNSMLLMPNRFYEGIFFRCPLIVLRDTEVSVQAKSLDVGIEVEEVSPVHLQKRLDVQRERLLALESNCEAVADVRIWDGGKRTEEPEISKWLSSGTDVETQQLGID